MNIFLDEKRIILKKIASGAGFRLWSVAVSGFLYFLRIIVYARLFTPNDLGIVVLATSCVNIVALFAEYGLDKSVIKDNKNSTAFSNTAFTIALVFGVFLTVVSLIFAPLFSRVFSVNMNSFFRVLVLVIILGVPFKFPMVFWEKELKFNKSVVSRLIEDIISFISVIFIHILFQFGIWSIILGSAIGSFISILYVWIFADIRPSFMIDMACVKKLMVFGIPFMIQHLNGFIMNKGDNLIVGKIWGPKQLAFYDFAWSLPLIIGILVQTIDSMLFPVFTRFNDREDVLRQIFNLSCKMWSILGGFFGFAMIIYADYIVQILYGATWKPVVPILRVMALSFTLRFCTGYGYDNLVLARGRMVYMMKWSFVNSLLVFTVGLLMIYKLGPIGGAWFWVLQAAVLIPLVRLPLIYRELKTLEYLKHVWQPFVSGIFAALLGCLVIKIHPWEIEPIWVSFFVFFLAYMSMLLWIDRRLVESMKKIYFYLK